MGYLPYQLVSRISAINSTILIEQDILKVSKLIYLGEARSLEVLQGGFQW